MSLASVMGRTDTAAARGTAEAGAAPFAERALSFTCGGETLFGVLATPAGGGAAEGAGAPASGFGVVIVVGGPQVRTGAHRQFTRVARTLAAAGHAVLRFDVRGMGDSTGGPRRFDTLDDDLAAAIDTLCAAAPGVRRVGLWALCDGASAALLYLHARRDARVAALALFNPWVRSEATLARAHLKHYYRERLLDPAFWKKLVAGGVGPRALTELLRSLGRARGAGGGGGAGRDGAGASTWQARMAAALAAFRGPVLLGLSGRDLTAREFEAHAAADPAWRAALASPAVLRVAFDDADHTFSAAADDTAMRRATLDWAARA